MKPNIEYIYKKENKQRLSKNPPYWTPMTSDITKKKDVVNFSVGEVGIDITLGSKGRKMTVKVNSYWDIYEVVQYTYAHLD